MLLFVALDFLLVLDFLFDFFFDPSGIGMPFDGQLLEFLRCSAYTFGPRLKISRQTVQFTPLLPLEIEAELLQET